MKLFEMLVDVKKIDFASWTIVKNLILLVIFIDTSDLK